MLRVYAAAHGLASAHHAVVEIGAEEIVLRVDTRWVRFTQTAETFSDGRECGFELHEDGSVTLNGVTEELDMAAEGVARAMFSA